MEKNEDETGCLNEYLVAYSEMLRRNLTGQQTKRRDLFG